MARTISSMATPPGASLPPARRGRALPRSADPPEEVRDALELTGARKVALALLLGVSAAIGMAASAGVPLPAAAAGAVLAAPQAGELEQLRRLAFATGDDAPAGEGLRWLERYVRTDYGSGMVRRVLEDYEAARAAGWIDPEGELTPDGHFAGYVPFRIRGTPGAAAGGSAEIRLPFSFRDTFRFGGQRVDPLAIVHHEFGHTRYGLPAGPEDLRETVRGTRLSLEHEARVVDRFENPVRLRNGFEPRFRYYDEEGTGFACSALYGCDPGGASPIAGAAPGPSAPGR